MSSAGHIAWYSHTHTVFFSALVSQGLGLLLYFSTANLVSLGGMLVANYFGMQVVSIRSQLTDDAEAKKNQDILQKICWFHLYCLPCLLVSIHYAEAA